MKKLMVFTAPQCQPCRRVKVEVEEFIDDFPTAQVEIIDATKTPETVESLGVMAVPTLIVINGDGKILGRITGFVTSGQIRELFAA